MKSPAPAPTIGSRFTKAEIARARSYAVKRPMGPVDPRLAALVNDLIDRVADKWTMLILETLTEHAPLRFSRLADKVAGISQKMLTQTVRQMERDGLVTRTVFAEVPPRVEYELTPLGLTLGGAFCGVWVWASDNLRAVETARHRFDARPKPR
jgi:DNA-binding HxlR family transcriptional regulator